ncbi:hypothetical protein BAX97_13405 [Elizabethkingia meningoseptica]|uniref:DUF6759 domain-containing protein n=1 Tax=Elizabethkingia meningoseptica TaxID=238 RepID=UPI0009998528|nr:DUF6759 domain-containing protein [Elizabethkingia meningoseptica]OPC32263.1 hypothetical protein BAX97_13405 [Elizabethkingia meningoseptica]
MKKYLFLIAAAGLLSSCNMMNYGAYNRFPKYPSYPGNNNTSVTNTEQEYNELMKTYKPETEAVLNDLLNSTNPNALNTSLVVKNESSCNMVLTVSGNNGFKRIPIGTGKVGYAMLRKGIYTLSANVCRKVYRETMNVNTSQQITLSN